MGFIRAALGIITLIADIVTVFAIVRKAARHGVASYKRMQRRLSPSAVA